MVLFKKKRTVSWLAVFAIAVFVEFILANYSSLRAAKEEKMILTQEQTTDESGKFIIENVIIERNIKNIMVDLSLTNGEYAEIYVAVTDQGNKYQYEMPVTRIFPKVEETKYINIYPYGKVTTLHMEVRVPETVTATIHEISLNDPMGPSFKVLRFVVLLGILILFHHKSLMQQWSIPDFDPQNKRQRFVTAGVCIVTIAGVIFLAKSNPRCVEEPWLHHKQYQELAEVLKRGEVILKHKVDDRLKEMENPYDTIALQVEDIKYNMDYAYYDEAYYVYFGIIPELLLYLPYHVITGRNLPNYVAGIVFSILLIIGAFWVSKELVIRWQKKILFLHYLLLSLSICYFSQVLYMFGRPDIYHIPIIAGNAFTFLGLGAWLAALNNEKKSEIFLAAGSLFMAMVVGCRPQMALYSFTVLALFYSFTVKERNLFSRKGWRNTLAFTLPYGIIAIPVCWYNWKRFGSIFEFGATFSLTTNDMNTRGFNWERIWNGVFSFLFQPPSVISRFPFIQKTDLDIYYMGRNMTEFTFGGLLIVNSLVWIIFYFLLIEKKKKFSMEYRTFCLLLLFPVLIIAMFDANGAGILQRYMGDLIPGITLSSVLCWIHYLDRGRAVTEGQEKGGKNIHRLFVLLFVINITYSFLMLFAKGDSINLYDDNPILYHQIRSYFEL